MILVNLVLVLVSILAILQTFEISKIDDRVRQLEKGKDK